MTAATTIFRRPKATSGFWGWVTTIDHKKIGVMYGYTAFFFLIMGGLEALLLRLQLAGPEGETVTKNTPLSVNSHKLTTNCAVCEKIHYSLSKLSQ